MKQLRKQLTVIIFTLLLIALIGEALLALPALLRGLTAQGPFGGAWILFAFVSGAAMVVLPSTFPILFLIAPLMRGKELIKGLSVAVAFSIGVLSVLTFYGVLGAVLGKYGFALTEAHTAIMQSWMYFLGGIFAYIFALGEIGLLPFMMSSYLGPLPSFIKRRGTILKALLLGLFLGNIGVGSGSPALPLLFVESASHADLYYGGILFFTHGLGRILPLLGFLFFASLGSDVIPFITARKESFERASGWAMVAVSALVITIGLFPALPNTGWESGILGQPLEWARWCFVLLVLLPLWLHYMKEERRVFGHPGFQLSSIDHKRAKLLTERRGLEMTLDIPKYAHERVSHLEHRIEILEKERKLIEDSLRYGSKKTLRGSAAEEFEVMALRLRRNWYLTLTVLIAVFFFFIFHA